MSELVAQSGSHTKVGTPKEAISASEVILEAIPFGLVPRLPLAQLKGEILLSASNYFPGRDGTIDMKGLTQTAWMSTQLPEVIMVKTFSMMGAAVLNRHADGDKGKNYAIFLAGNDSEAKHGF